MRLTFGFTHLSHQIINTVSGYLSVFYVRKSVVIIFLAIVLFYSKTFSQPTADTIKYHSAKKATIMSACLPGLGQAYNKKYWKIPVIYAGFSVLTYFIIQNGTEYRNFRNAYNIVATGDTANFNNSYVVRYRGDLTLLQEGRNFYRRNLEFTYILSGILYILNIVDASVDGNLYNFEVSDDLSLHFEAVQNQSMWARGPTPAVTLRFKF